jgi:mRNA degradation ribonuclease J1/J2
LGPNYQSANVGKNRPIFISEVEIDEQTKGLVGIAAEGMHNGRGDLLDLMVTYWWVKPNGEQGKETLFKIVNQIDGDEVRPSALYVLGRDRLDDTAENLNRYFAALKQTMTELRAGKLPSVVSIFKRYKISESVSERLHLTGRKIDTHSPSADEDQPMQDCFDFVPSPRSAELKFSDLRVPATFVHAMSGIGCSTLDNDQRLFPSKRSPIMETDHRTGARFGTQVRLTDDGKNVDLKMGIESHTALYKKSGAEMPNLAQTLWAEVVEGVYRPVSLKVQGQEYVDQPLSLGMQIQGFVNKSIHDARLRFFPYFYMHLANYNLLHLFDHFALPRKLSEGGEFVFFAQGGNNAEEIAEKMGDQIGGNSWIYSHRGLDENGRVDEVSLQVDDGIFIAPEGGSYTHSCHQNHPTAKHKIITHIHADHNGGLIEKTSMGFEIRTTVYGTDDVLLHLTDQFKLRHIDKALWPRMVPLKGKGVINIPDASGQTRLSFYYSAEGMTHSAKGTPIVVVGRGVVDGQKKILGSVYNPGDVRYESHRSPDYNGPPPRSDNFDSTFLQDWRQALLEAEPDIDPAELANPVTLAGFDGTYIMREGLAPTEREIEENLTKMMGWLKKKYILTAIIASNDGRYRSAMWAATRQQYNITSVGLNAQLHFRRKNKLGVDNALLPPEEKDNIKPFLEHIASVLTEEKREARREELTTQGFDEASIEQKLAEQASEFTVQPVEYKGRTTKTVYKWIADSMAKIMFVITGTQVNEAEFYSTLSKILRGVSQFQLSQRFRRYALPISLEKEAALFVLQTTIPGNSASRKKFFDEMKASTHIPTFESYHGGFYAYNLTGQDRANFIAGLREDGKAEGRDYKILSDDTIQVDGMPIHVSGHNQRENTRLQIAHTDAEILTLQHFNADPESHATFFKLVEAQGKKHTGRVIYNGEGIKVYQHGTIEKKLKPVGRRPYALYLCNREGPHDKVWLERTTYVPVTRETGQEMTAVSALLPYRSKPMLHRQVWANIEVTRRKPHGTEPVRRNRVQPEPARSALPAPFRTFRGPLLPLPQLTRPPRHPSMMPKQKLVVS